MATFLKESKIYLVVVVSFLVGWLLTFLCLPRYWELVFPEWLGLVVLYWVYVMPKYINVGVAFIVGILLDILYNTPLGLHALALVLSAYFITKLGEKVELLKFWKIAAMILSVMVIYQGLLLLPQVYLGRHFGFWLIFGRVVLGTLIWLVMATLLNYKRHKLYFEKYY